MKKGSLTEDALIGQLLDRLQRMVNEINTILSAAYLPPKAVAALVNARISVIGTYHDLKVALREAEEQK